MLLFCYLLALHLFPLVISQVTIGAPRNLKLIANDSTLLKISWEIPDGLNETEVTQFRVVYTFDVDEYSESKTLLINDTSSRVADLKVYPNLLYRISVAEKMDSYGETSEITATSRAGAPQAAPKEIIITKVRSTSCMISWTPVPKYLQGGVMEYLVFIEGSTRKPDTFPSNITSTMMTDLKPNTTYIAIVLPKTESGVLSDGVPKANFTTNLPAPSPPRNVTVLSKTRSTIQIEWFAPEIPNDVKFYIIYVTEIEKNKIVQTVNVVAVKLSTTIKNLQPDTEYSIKMIATNTEFSNSTSPQQVRTEKEPEVKSDKRTLYISIIVPLLLVFIVLVVLIAIIYIRRRSGRKQKKSLGETSPGGEKTQPDESTPMV